MSENQKKKFWLKSKTNQLSLTGIGAGVLALVMNDEFKDVVCKTLCESPKSAAGLLVMTGVMNLFSRNFKSNTSIKLEK